MTDYQRDKLWEQSEDFRVALFWWSGTLSLTAFCINGWLS